MSVMSNKADVLDDQMEAKELFKNLTLGLVTSRRFILRMAAKSDIYEIFS